MKIAALLLLVLVIGCVGTQPAKNVTVIIDNVEYNFANDISEAKRVPVSAPDGIRSLLLASKDINIIFDCSAPEDKPYITVAAFNTVTTVQNYFVYSRGRSMNFYTYCFTDAAGSVQWFDAADMNVTAPTPKDASLWIKGEHTGATATNVELNDTTVVIQGIGYKNLTLATDAFNLAFLGAYRSSARATAAYFCNADSDCAIKDVHNCCGYYPRCVNTNFTPDIEAVRRSCQETGSAGICGWPEITQCKCVENTCISMEDGRVV